MVGVFYYHKVFIVMILTEGRKENVYEKYKKLIDNQRKLVSDVQPLSYYDVLVNDDFMKQTNYKYLEPLVNQYFNYDRTGLDVDEIEPLRRDIALRHLREMMDMYEDIVQKVWFFDNNKSKYDKNDLNDYVGDTFDSQFLDFTDKLMQEKTNKQLKDEVKSNTKRIFENDKVLIVRPLSFESSCYYGAGTKWCTTTKDRPSFFQDYSSTGGLYYIILKNIPPDNQFYKIALHLKFGFSNVMLGEWRDSKDDLLTPGELKMFMTFVPDEAFRKIEEENKVDINQLIELATSKFFTQYQNYIWRTTFIFTMYKYKLEYQLVLKVVDKFDINTLGFFYSMNLNRILFNNKHEVDIPLSKRDEFPYSDGHASLSVIPSSSEKTIGLGMDFEMNDGMKMFDSVNRVIPIEDFNADQIESFIDNISRDLYANWRIAVYNDSVEVLKKFGMKEKFLDKYTFEKRSKNLMDLYKYMDSLPEGTTGTRADFLVKTGRLVKKDGEYYVPRGDYPWPITLRGYMSEFFSAVRAAKILDPKKQGLVKGINYEKYKEKLFKGKK
jgi:hypothetical protein